MNTTVFARRTDPIGHKVLYRVGPLWYVSLVNKTYRHVHAIAPDKVDDWKRAFGLLPAAKERPQPDAGKETG